MSGFTTDLAFQQHISPHCSLSYRRSILASMVAGYILLLPYQFQLGKTMNFAPSDCFLILALIVGVVQLKWVTTVWTIWHLGLVLTFVSGSLVCALNYGVLASYELLNKDLGLIIPFLSYLAITSVVTTWGELRGVLRLFAVSVVFQNILALTAYFAAHFFGVATSFAQYEDLRLSGMLLDPNAYGGLLAMTLVICETASSGQMPLFGSWTLMLSRISLTMGILFTFSRSAWLGLSLALLLLCLLRIRVASRFFVSLFVGAPCLLWLIGPTFISVIGDMASRPKQVQERFDLIQLALQAFQQHPLLGGGLGSFRLTVGEIAHNSAMWFLADFGVFGLGVFLGFLAWFFSRAWATYQTAPSHQQPLVLALLLAHTTMAGVAMGIEAFYQRHWWLVFALIGSAYTLTRRSMAEMQLERQQTPEPL